MSSCSSAEPAFVRLSSRFSTLSLAKPCTKDQASITSRRPRRSASGSFAPVTRSDDVEELPEGRSPGGGEPRIGPVEPGAAEHQRKMLRVLQGEGDVALAARDELRARIGGRPPAPLAHRLGEALEADRRHLGQERGHVGEMVRRRRMRDAGAPGAAAQRKALHALFCELGFCGIEQGGAEIAMVIGRRRGRWTIAAALGLHRFSAHLAITGLLSGISLAFGLDSV